MLLECEDVDADHMNEDGQTPLFKAVGKGYEGIVKMLLERVGVDPNTGDNCGETALANSKMRISCHCKITIRA